MRPARSAYLVGALAVGGARAVSAAAGFASLWLLSQILSKEMLGGYAFAFNVVLLAGLLATLGLERSLLLRIAGEQSDGNTLKGGRLAIETAVLVALMASILSLCLARAAAPMAQFDGMAQAADWLGALSWAIVPFALTSVLQSWFQANHRVYEAVAAPGLSDAVRCLCFAGVLIAGLGASGVAWAVPFSAAVPVIVLAALAARRFTRGVHVLRLRDFGPAGNFLVIRFATQAASRAELVLVGLLASATATAEYAVAAQLALLADAGRLALKPSFAPRVRFHLRRADLASAAAEYEAARFWSHAGALLAAAGLTTAGGSILELFGEFHEAYRPLLLLAAGYVVTAGCGMHTTYLNMTGETGWSAILRSFGLVLLVSLAVLLIPIAGTPGAAWSVLVATVAINAIGVLILRHLTGFAAIRTWSIIGILAAAAALVLAAHSIISAEVAGAILLICLAVEAAQRSDLRRMASRVCALLASR